MKIKRPIIKLIKTIRASIKNDNVNKSLYYSGLKQCLKWFIVQTLNLVIAPIIYPIFYLNRKRIYRKYVEGGFPEDIQELCVDGDFVEDTLPVLRKVLGWWLFWLWTFGDEKDIIGKGIVPEWYKPNIKNNFLRRYLWSAIRNPRAIYSHAKCRTAGIAHILPKGVGIWEEHNKVHFNGLGYFAAGYRLIWLGNGTTNYPYFYSTYGKNNTRLFYFGMVHCYYNNTLMQYRRFELSMRGGGNNILILRANVVNRNENASEKQQANRKSKKIQKNEINRKN